MSVPSSLYDIKPGMSGRTREWGAITVLKSRAGRVTFRASGGAGSSGVFWTTRSILFYNTTWVP